MPRKKLVIIGAGHYAEEVAEIANAAFEFELIGFIEGLDRNRCDRLLAGLPIFWHEDLRLAEKDLWAICAIGSPLRRNPISQLEVFGFHYATLVHPRAAIATTVELGKGTSIGAGTVIAARTSTGRHVVVNRGCLIGHHSSIGNYVTISPGANIAGKTSIGNGTYIGMGAIILDGISIGSNVIVGAGALVTRNVTDNVQVMGFPAKIVKDLAP